MIVREVDCNQDPIAKELARIAEDVGAEPEMIDTIIAFLRLEPTTRNVVMQLYCPHSNPRSENFRRCGTVCRLFAELDIVRDKYPWVTAEVLTRFLVIWDINCHGEYLYNLATRLRHS